MLSLQVVSVVDNRTFRQACIFLTQRGRERRKRKEKKGRGHCSQIASVLGICICEHSSLFILHFPFSIFHFPFSILHFPFSIFHSSFVIFPSPGSLVAAAGVPPRPPCDFARSLSFTPFRYHAVLRSKRGGSRSARTGSQGSTCPGPRSGSWKPCCANYRHAGHGTSPMQAPSDR